MFIGYPNSTIPDIYKMLNLKTNIIIKTRDILWLYEFYRDYKKRTINQPDELDIPLPVNIEEAPPPHPITTIQDKIQPSPPKLPCIVQELDTFYNPILLPSQSGKEAIAIKSKTYIEATPLTLTAMDRGGPGSQVLEVKEADPNHNSTFKLAAMLIDLSLNNKGYEKDEELLSYNEAWNNDDSIKQKKWREAILKELKDMESRKVGKNIKEQHKPKDCRCVKSKWVFKIKKNGIYRARLVACSYSQIPGVDFNKNPYSPVINDVTYKILLILSLIMDYCNVIIDIVTAFLYGTIEKGEKVYMNCP